MASLTIQLRQVTTIAILVLSLVTVDNAAASQKANRRPNIVLIMADDLGRGDVGCFGNDTIRTPNIDRIAREGAKLNHHLSAAAMCTPSRTAFLTGRYPIRSGMVPHDVFRVIFFLSAVSGLPQNETTIGEIAQEAGYKTGFIGKWHLGLNCEEYRDFCHHPLKNGFDHYYGVPLTNLKDYGDKGLTLLYSRRPDMNYILFGIFAVTALFAYMLKRMKLIGRKGFLLGVFLGLLPTLSILWALWSMKHLNPIVMRNYDIVEQPIDFGSITDRLVGEGVDFIKKRADDAEPFLLIMSWIQVHTVLHASNPFKGRSAHGSYGDEVEEMDWSVGQILEALDAHGLSQDTFVFFTSDHGGHNEERGPQGQREGGWNGIFRGGKGQGGMEGGIRVPTVARWPSVIPAGSTVDVPTSSLDVVPTVAGLIGGTVPCDRMIDGKDLMPVLRGEPGVQPPHQFLAHYCGDSLQAARYVPGDGSDVYKIHLATPNWHPGTQGCGFLCDCHRRVTWHDPPLMYNIARDPAETTPLDTTEPHHRAILKTMLGLVDKHKKGVDKVPSQFSHLRMAPRPWLEPCCNFPHCQCQETSTADKTENKIRDREL